MSFGQKKSRVYRKVKVITTISGSKFTILAVVVEEHIQIVVVAQIHMTKSMKHGRDSCGQLYDRLGQVIISQFTPRYGTITL